MAWLLRSGSWSWEPSVLIGLSLVAGGYAVLVSPLRRRLDWGGPVPFGRQLCFYLGTVSVFVALVSPLDILADEFLFSAHMAQHMLLTFVAAPLWLIGLPGWVPEQLASRARLVWAGTRLTQPAVAFVVFNGAMWEWHIPVAYDAALRSEPLHVFEHMTFMATAVLGWWPVIQRWPAKNHDPRPWRILYLFLSTFPCTALAAVITLSPHLLYSFYAEAPLKLGLSPIIDQQVGGLLMWLPADMILMLAALIVGNHWLVDQTGRQASGNQPRGALSE